MTAFLISKALIGFIGLKFYRHRTKEVHDIANGWNLVFLSLFWGVLGSIPSYLLLKQKYPIISIDLLSDVSAIKESIVLQYFGYAIVAVLIIAFIVSTITMQNFITKILAFIVNDKQPTYPSGLIPSNLLELAQERVLLSLTSGKVYVGILYRVDTNEKIIYENRGLVIVPIKSGYRKADKTVIYNTRYIDKDGHLNPLPLTIKLSEIESFCKFSPEIDKYFSDLKKKRIEKKETVKNP